LATLKSLFRWALNREIVESSPVAGLEKPHQEKPRDRVLSDVELVAVWRAAEQMHWPYSPIVTLLVTTAARRDEVAGMKWSELNIDQRLWSIPSSRRKAGVPNELPLNDLAMEVLQSLPRFKGSDWVFPARPRAGGRGSWHFSGWSKAKLRLDALSGVKKMTLHDLRRTAATRLQQLKIPVPIVEEVLGHSSGSRSGIVGTYQKYRYETEKRAALDTWSRYLRSLLDPSSSEADNVVALAR
jgi:integrase